MPTTTPNFGWSVPVSTDLVKDGATAIELLGDSIDASLVDLKGGTTGQVLAKASGTDLDFTFVTPAGGGGMTSIASGSLSTGTLTLSSIVGTFKDLKLVIRNGQCSNAANWSLRVNNDSAGNYGRLAISQNLNTLATNAAGNGTSWQLNFATIKASRTTTMIIDIPDYANATATKVFESISAYEDATSGENTTVFAAGSFVSATAITRLDLILSTGTFSAGTYILYGVN